MKIKTKLYNKTLYVLLSGELDEHSASNIRRNLDILFDTEKGFTQVVMDLSELEFMDSTGIGVLIGRYKKFRRNGVDTYLTNPSQSTDKILSMSGVYTLMPKI